jgi:Helix-turn-helix domain
MSIAALDWVLKHSEATLGSRLVLIALADTAHDDGTRSFPSVETIARKARMTRRAAQTGLRKLEEEQHIKATGRTRGGTIVYAILGMGGEDSTRVVDDRGGVVDARRGVVDAPTSGVASTPEPIAVREPSRNNGSEPIGFEEWLEHHSELTGQRMPGRSTKARADLARKFSELTGEGRDLADMKLASIGAHSDKWRRDNDKTYPRNVLVFATIDELIDKGRRAKPPASSDRPHSGRRPGLAPIGSKERPL